jgi:hypothetical protein
VSLSGPDVEVRSEGPVIWYITGIDAEYCSHSYPSPSPHFPTVTTFDYSVGQGVSQSADYSGRYQRGRSYGGAPWWGVCRVLSYTMWIGRRRGSRPHVCFSIFAASCSWGTLSQSLVASPETRWRSWCVLPSICVFARVFVCRPVWAEGLKPYLGHRPARILDPWGRRWRLVGWEYGYSVPIDEATPP